MSSRIFEDELTASTVFKDMNVLSPHYVPKELPYRKNEIKQVTKVMSSVLLDVKPLNIFLYGKTGTGKTSVVKTVLRELELVVSDPLRNKSGMLSYGVYMNCRLGYNSKYQILLKILEDHQLNTDKISEKPLKGVRNNTLGGRSPTELYAKLQKVVQANALHLIIVLDEIDMVRDLNDLLYTLTRVNDQIEPVKIGERNRRGSVSIIGISNKHSFKNALDPRTKSTLLGEEIVFKPYNANQLKTILANRVREGFKKGSISASNIGLIAAFAAQTNGDARYALRLLQKAGEIAQSNKRKRVKKEDVQTAKSKIEEDIIHELITTLPEHQQIVLYAISDLVLRGGQYRRLSDLPGDILFSGEVYEGYEKVCKSLSRNPRTMRWFGEYLKELEMLGLVTLSLSGSGVRGTTTLIRLGASAEEIKKMVSISLGLLFSEKSIK
ncbi:MAG: AAA family ATPase [Candidatus Altiarchaeota archaeon]|nr:AAA family ATPase [Candidatus Altiarchaeota archaeon]